MIADVEKAVANGATYGGSAATLVGFLTVTEWCAVGGFIVAIAGLVWSVYIGRETKRLAAESKRLDAEMAHAANKRAEEEHELSMAIKLRELAKHEINKANVLTAQGVLHEIDA